MPGCCGAPCAGQGCKARLQGWLVAMLERRYSGIREVVGLVDKVREKVESHKLEELQEHEKDSTDGAVKKEINEGAIELKEKADEEGLFKPEDGKWRPVLGTISLIYKLQKVSDDNWYDHQDVFMADKEKAAALVDLLGYIWDRSLDVAKNIDGEEEEELRKNLATGLELPIEDVLYVFNKDAEKGDVEEHCPDIAVTLDREKKELVLTVCGTKVFPVPSPADIIMDLYADCVPFHKGRAHRGMAAACDNILERVLDLLVAKLAELEDYHRLVIVGYSLGAGVAQLLALRLTEGPENAQLPAGTVLKCITFGAPPVYAASEPGYVNPAIISVYNHNDGLASLSLHTVTRLFLQIRAINRLCLGRRQTLRLLRSRLGEQTVEGGTRRFLATAAQPRAAGWDNVAAATDAVLTTGFTELTHCAGTTYLVKRVDPPRSWYCMAGADPGHVVRKLNGREAEPLARELRLRAGMFNDHMPWGYVGLFKGCGGSKGLSLDVLKYL